MINNIVFLFLLKVGSRQKLKYNQKCLFLKNSFTLVEICVTYKSSERSHIPFRNSTSTKTVVWNQQFGLRTYLILGSLPVD